MSAMQADAAHIHRRRAAPRIQAPIAIGYFASARASSA